MRRLPPRRLLPLVLLLALICSCTSAPRRAEPTVRADPGVLRNMLTIPGSPTDLRWVEIVRGDGFLGPQDRELLALLRYPHTPDLPPPPPSNPTASETLVFPLGTWSHRALADWGLAPSGHDVEVVATPLPPDAWRPSSFTTIRAWWLPVLRVVYLQACSS